MPQLVLDSSGVIPGRHHWPPARLPDQGSLKEASWPSGDNLDCQPRLLAIPGLGHPRPLVIRRHPWPSRGNLGCQPWLVVTPDLGHPWSFGLQETSPAIGRQPWLPPLATSSTSRPGVTEGDILAPALLQPCSPALLTSAPVSRAPGHQCRCQRREWRGGPKAGDGRERIYSTLVSPSGRARIRERR